MMRIAFFGTSGAFTAQPLEAVHSRHEVVALVRPAPPGFRSLSMLRRIVKRLRSGVDPITRFAEQNRIRQLWMQRGDLRLVHLIRALDCDVICVSSFRWKLPSQITSLARLEAVNLHASLLPRHRGAVPLFWIFHSDDRETGVTVHRLRDRLDAGEILGQDGWPLQRGTTADELNERNAARGSALLLQVLAEIEAGSSTPRPQDERAATKAPAPPIRGRMIDFSSWQSERVWHFLKGVFPYYKEDLGIDYQSVIEWRSCTPAGTPGTVDPSGEDLILHCIDGLVRLEGAG